LQSVYRVGVPLHICKWYSDSMMQVTKVSRGRATARLRFFEVLLLSIITLVMLSACVISRDARSILESNQVSVDMLLDSSPLGKDVGEEDFSQVDILEMTPEMKAFLDSYVDDTFNRYARMKRLLYAVMGEGKFELVYDDKTHTAPETFQHQGGNCLSFTNMFVAMARYLGIHASFQEVDIPPDWSQAGQSFLFSQHVNVHVDLGADTIRIIDFNIYNFNHSYERRVISDQRARAHYFSNIGVEQMLDGESAVAYANFRQALIEDSTFSPAWINLGILHRREGYLDFAETSYLQALEVDNYNLIALSNLASLYEQEGMTERAESYRSMVRSHRMNNPYYRYQLAQAAVIDGDYQDAINHLKFAIRKREGEDRFYFLMSLSYLMSGDEEAAEQWMKKAEAVAGDDADKQRYHNKLDRLMSQGPEGQ